MKRDGVSRAAGLLWKSLGVCFILGGGRGWGRKHLTPLEKEEIRRGDQGEMQCCLFISMRSGDPCWSRGMGFYSLSWDPSQARVGRWAGEGGRAILVRGSGVSCL